MTHPDPSAADELLAPATLAEARKVCEAATPGPWYWHDSDMVTDRVQLDPRETDYYEDHGRTAIIITDSGYYPPRENDRAFIVLARTLLPALIDRVEALTDLERYVRGCIPEGRSIAQHLLRLDELEAEVERLRAENEALNDFIQQRAQKCCENLKRDMRAELERLRAENAALIEAKFVSLVTPEELKRLRADALTTVEANALRRSSLLSLCLPDLRDKLKRIAERQP